MNLVDERESWKVLFESVGRPLIPTLDAYERNRRSEFWRASRQSEMMCEYILYLEQKLRELE